MPRQIGGYIWRRELRRGKCAVRDARSYIQRILEERPGQALAAVYLANVAVQMGNISDVLDQLSEIADEQAEPPEP